MRRTRLADPAVQVVARQIQDKVDTVAATTSLNGRMVSNGDLITLTNVTTMKIQHGLGRQLAGYRIDDLVVEDSSARPPAATGHIQRLRIDTATGKRPDDTREIWLYALGYSGLNPRIRLWVY